MTDDFGLSFASKLLDHYRAGMERDFYLTERMFSGREPSTYAFNIRVWEPMWPWRVGARVKARWGKITERVGFAWEVLRHDHTCPED